VAIPSDNVGAGLSSLDSPHSKPQEDSTVSNNEGPQYVRQESVVEPVGVGPAGTEPTGGPLASPPVTQQGVEPVGAVRTSYSRRFAPDAMIAAAVGVVLLVVGILAMIRGGFDGSMEEPIVDVLGFTHTTTLGIVEAVLGALLLIAGASSWRSGALFFGAVLAIGGFVGAVQTESFTESLALESNLAWIAVGAGVVVVISALLMPRYVSSSTTVQAV
jgi:hypothetical protein